MTQLSDVKEDDNLFRTHLCQFDVHGIYDTFSYIRQNKHDWNGKYISCNVIVTMLATYMV